MSEYISFENLAASAKTEYEKLQATLANGPLSPKDRMAIPQQEMPTGEPKERARLMTEVALGYTKEQAIVEANRCLQCKTAPCVNGCPVNVPIPQFLAEVAKGEFKAAVDIIKTANLLPAICGRVCPQEKQCQGQCTVGKTYKNAEKAVSIGRLERFCADFERENNLQSVPEVAPETGKKVAIIGSGPAGLTVAADVRRAGHSVTVFEAFHKAGGVMVYGIPEFRLPKSIVAKEIDMLKQMGVEFRTNFLVGRTGTLPQLLKEAGFDAAFIGTGAGLPKFMNIEGENLIGVFSANEYLTRANLMKAYDREHADTPLYEAKHVVVVGGGNVAMDAARMGYRLGADEVDIIYRRTKAEMPARREEVAHAEEEGVNFRYLENPVKINGDENGRVKSVTVLSYELGEPDASGRRSPVAIPGSEHDIDCDAVIVALGNGSNPLMEKTTPGLTVDKKGHITVDETGMTSIEGVWAGGDIVLGAATVILAMGEGRKAAASINNYLNK
ncbi:MAG: NADPH-dependent glutamate synthase [Spirochaetaceae bacterium]|nr:NADPH-dependent glutamate synthase [Spirochaetaceae bacterium]MBQ4555347.1 NADPH-dependent glutamate synthase [Spirochaetaceae bacterium]